jgi:hypothetical protein
VDGEVLGPQLARQRHQVVLVRLVVGVHHGGGDDAGRRRGGEGFDKRRPGRRNARLETGDLVLDVLGVEITHLGHRLWGVGELPSPGEAAQEHLDQLRHLLEVLADLALGFAGKTRHARRDVGLEADALLLAVVADVDPSRRLGRNRFAHGAVHLPRHRGRINRLPGLAADQQVGQHIVARQAADVGRQDAVAVVKHGLSLEGMDVYADRAIR